MKIAITGKGGVGKTTLSGLLARAFANDGFRVLAIDADPDANLASAVGVKDDQLDRLIPISEMKDLAKQRTGADQNSVGLFVLNPTVDDLPDQYCVEHAGVRLLMMGSVKQGGSGCVCPEHTLLRSLMRHLLLEREDIVIMDMEAGIEHLGRATADAVDLLVVVVEPGSRSLQTSSQIERLAKDIGVKRVAYVASKVSGNADEVFLKKALQGKHYLGKISSSDVIKLADREGACAYETGGQFVQEVTRIKENLSQLVSPT